MFNDGTGQLSVLADGNAVDLPLDNPGPGAVFFGQNLCVGAQNNQLTGGDSFFGPVNFTVERSAGTLSVAGLGSSTTNDATVKTFFESQNSAAFDVLLNGGTATAVAAVSCGM